MASILVVGCGDIGYRVALALHQRDHNVTGLKRQPLVAPSPFPIVTVDIRQAASLSVLSAEFDVVLFIVSPGSRQSEEYRALYFAGLSNLLEHFANAKCSPRWFMVSSTSVYGQNRGEWVDETSITEPQAATGQWLVAAERRLWQDDLAHCVVRFSGIYGPGRDWLLRRAAQCERIQQQPPSFTNRIHQDDCVAVLLYLIEQYLAGRALQSCYLASDDDPAPLWDVINWIVDQFAYPQPRALMLQYDAPCNKRCNNARIKALGYRFLYPSYREGYCRLSQSASV